MKTSLRRDHITKEREDVRAVSLVAFAGASLVAALLLSGCAGSGQTAQGNDDTAPVEQSESSADEQQPDDAAVGTATAIIDGREFSFELTGCTLYQESELEISGPGSELGSDTPSYLDGGAMQLDSDPLGEFRIDIGADGPFQSSDDYLAFGAPTGGGDLTVVADGEGFLATGKSWSSDAADLGTGTLHFTCE